MRKLREPCVMTSKLTRTGVCVSRDKKHTCVATPYSTTPQSLNAAIASQLDLEDNRSLVPSLSTVETGLQLQQGVFFCLQAFAGVLFMISILLYATRLGIQASKARGRSWRFIKQGWSEKVLMVSVLFSVVSAASVTQTGNALQFATKRSGVTPLHIKVGHTLQVLEWLAFALSATFYVVIVKRMARKAEDGLPASEKAPVFPAAPPSLPRGPHPRPPPPPAPPPPPPPPPR